MQFANTSQLNISEFTSSCKVMEHKTRLLTNFIMKTEQDISGQRIEKPFLSQYTFYSLHALH